MRYVLAALGAAITLTIAAATDAAPVPLPDAIQALTDDAVAYAKKGGWHGGGKGWKHGWKHGRGWVTIGVGMADRHRGHPLGAGGASTATATATAGDLSRGEVPNGR